MPPRPFGNVARRAARVAGVLCVCLGVGCQGESTVPVTPEATLMAFARALNRGQFEDAYALMSEDYRKRVSLKGWRRGRSLCGCSLRGGPMANGPCCRVDSPASASIPTFERQ